LTLGLVIDNIWQSRVLEAERRDERVKIAEDLMGLQRLGLQRVLLRRDSTEDGHKTFDFFERMNQFQPKRHLILIGLTARYLTDYAIDQTREFLASNPDLKLEICLLDSESPCAPLRSMEVFGNEYTTKNNIELSIRGWQQLQVEFPSRIILRKSKAIPYAEYEAVDPTENRGIIYFIPIAYRIHTNMVPSFVLTNSQTNNELYVFCQETIGRILDDAVKISQSNPPG
jgi:hypothetical protein